MKRSILLYGIGFLSIFMLASCHDDIEYEKSDYEAIVDGSNHLGWKLLHELNDEKVNTFISPTSMYIMLSMLYPGADGTTKTELEDLLEVNQMDENAIQKANASFLDALDKADEETQLDIANSFWLEESFDVNKTFRKTIEHYFRAHLEGINRNNDDDVRKINDWVSEQTNNKIKQIVEGPLSDDFVAILINAVYFNGKWTFPFDKSDTTNDSFYPGGETERILPFMNLTRKWEYLKTNNFQSVKLPYGEKGMESMYIFLPQENVTLTDIQKDIQDKGIDGIQEQMEEQKGTISLPTFTLEYEHEMNQLLEQLGLRSAFDKEQADLPHILKGDHQLFISKVKHKTYLNIHEEGTEAAGVSSSEIETTSLPIGEPFEMIVNRPFFLLIVDEKTSSILFMGNIYDIQE